MKIKYYEASATVEAALILPLIIMIIFSFLWLLFFLYARIKAEADADLMAAKAGEEIVMEGKRDIERILEDYPEQYIGPYPYYTIRESSIDVEGNEVSVHTGLERSRGPVGKIAELTGIFSYIDYSGKIRIWNNPGIKRIISVILAKLPGEEEEGE